MLNKDYMGIVVVNHFIADESKPCFGSQMPSNAITEIAIYHAYVDDDNSIKKGDLITLMHMSDLQFGNIVSQPNMGNGHPVTLNMFKDMTIDDMQLKEDPATSNLASKAKRSVNLDSQTLRFMSEIDELIVAYKETGKLSAKDKKALIHLVELVKSNTKSNHSYHLRSVAETANKRLSEAKSEIHHIIRDAYRGINAPLAPLLIENKTQNEGIVLSPMAKVDLSHTSGNVKLFDSIGQSSRFMSLDVKGITTEEATKRIRGLNEDSSGDLYMPNTLLKLYLTIEQYAQFIRADHTEVPCTFYYIGNDYAKDKVVADNEDLILKGHRETINEILDDVMSIANNILTLLNGKMSTKADKEALTQLIDRFVETYEGKAGDIQDNANKCNETMLNTLQDKLEAFENDEIAKLPNHLQEVYQKRLGTKL